MDSPEGETPQTERTVREKTTQTLDSEHGFPQRGDTAAFWGQMLTVSNARICLFLHLGGLSGVLVAAWSAFLMPSGGFSMPPGTLIVGPTHPRRNTKGLKYYFSLLSVRCLLYPMHGFIFFCSTYALLAVISYLRLNIP